MEAQSSVTVQMVTPEGGQLVSSGDGTYKLINRHSGKVLDVNTSNNSVIQWDENGGQNQQWQI